MIPLNFAQEIDEDFAVDSFPKSRKRQIIRTIYPENKDERRHHRAMIDLDGTIHKYSKGYEDGSIYDDPFKGAKEAINYLKKHGYEIVIFTSRASKENSDEMGDGDYIEQIKKVGVWLQKHDIYFDRITSDKLAADFYIDDKAIHIPNGDWKVVLNILKKRMKYRTFA